ncbi:carboxylesterase [Actinokineospora bangkokensis]|uniref:Carboxylesterase n=1 Tax=Actinokineospora bangkokensis TaxID=1193682 RepID=A0A1Q9LP90_9PSEU|nr:carboxylesterase [Actinokineospora bangkokensis]
MFPEIPRRTTGTTIPTRHGPLPATLYHPPGRPGGAYVNAHGGGFVLGKPDMDDALCRFLAEHTGVVVVNVDYVLAPGHRFPAPCEQLYDAAVWAAEPEREWAGLGVCVGGQSAGGSLAAAAARLALRAGGPDLALQVLHYPPLDLATPARDKPVPPGTRPMLRPWMSEVFDTAYVPDPARRRDPLVSPAWGADVEDLTGIAPAVVITAEQDLLRAEAVTYAARLAEVGALVDHHDVPGVDHGYDQTGASPGLVHAAYSYLAGKVSDAVSA